MMNIGDKVIYKANGVCTIEEISRQIIPGTGSREGSMCYVLRPIHDAAIKIYVPLDHAGLVGLIRPIMTPDEVLALLERVPTSAMHWVEDLRTRSSIFRDILAKGDRDLLAGMIKLICEKRIEFRSSGKKLYAADEMMLKKAEKLLFEEAAYVLEMSEDDIALMFRAKLAPIELEV